MPTPKKDVLDMTLFLLSRREYCRYDIARKLKDKGYCISDIKKALTWAVNNNYINEERYTNLYVEQALTQKNQGKRRIISELTFKHIPEKYIKAALETYHNPQEEKNKLHDIIIRRLAGDTSQKSQNRVIRYLLSHGFDYAVIKTVFDEILG